MRVSMYFLHLVLTFTPHYIIMDKGVEALGKVGYYTVLAPVYNSMSTSSSSTITNVTWLADHTHSGHMTYWLHPLRSHDILATPTQYLCDGFWREFLESLCQLCFINLVIVCKGTRL